MRARSLSVVAPALFLAACAASPAERGPERPGAAARFQVRHQLDVPVPENAQVVRIWMAVPNDDPAQEISAERVESPAPHRMVQDSEGNRYLYVELARPAAGTVSVVNTFDVARWEAHGNTDPCATRPPTGAELAAHAAHLGPHAHVPVDARMRELACSIVGTETNPTAKARRIYDWVLANIDYWVKDPANKKASKVGSSDYCLESRTGNCTDFHSLWMSLARAADLPTRITYGSLFKPELDGVDKDASYHCWLEYWAPGAGWIPLDVAVADIFDGTYPVDDANAALVRLTTATGYSGPDPSMVAWYFGNLDARRVTWNRGRDLVLQPAAAAGPVNAVPKAYVEVDGRPLETYTRKMTYRGIVSTL